MPLFAAVSSIESHAPSCDPSRQALEERNSVVDEDDIELSPSRDDQWISRSDGLEAQHCIKPLALGTGTEGNGKDEPTTEARDNQEPSSLGVPQTSFIPQFRTANTPQQHPGQILWCEFPGLTDCEETFPPDDEAGSIHHHVVRLHDDFLRQLRGRPCDDDHAFSATEHPGDTANSENRMQRIPGHISSDSRWARLRPCRSRLEDAWSGLCELITALYLHGVKSRTLTPAADDNLYVAIPQTPPYHSERVGEVSGIGINHDAWPIDQSRSAMSLAPCGRQKQERVGAEAIRSTPTPTSMFCPYEERWTCGDGWQRHGRKWPENNDSRSDLRRHIARAADGVSIFAGGMATAVMLNFNQASGTCPSLEDDHRWPAMFPLLRHLPPALRCPRSPAYITAIFMYSAAGIFQVMREPRYWTDCALLAVIAAIVTGALYGVRPMVDALVLGGLLSLACCRGMVWSASACQRD